MEKQVTLDEEKVKNAAEKLKEVDVDKLFSAFVAMLKTYSYLAKNLGMIQRDNKDAFEALTYLGEMAPRYVQILAERAPPAEFGAFIKAFMELIELAPKLDKLMSLSAEEKIVVGEKLESIANVFDEMIKKGDEQKIKGEK